MKLVGEKRDVPGWVAGVQEDAEPASGFDRYGNPIGVLDESLNLVPTEVGRVAIRGGSQAGAMGALKDGALVQMDRSLTLFPFSSVGAVAVSHLAAASKHYGFACASDFSAMIHRTDLTWNSATPATNVQGKELWEKYYVCDANPVYASRNQLVAVDAGGTLTAVVADFGSGSEAVKPYCIEVFNGNLFIAGQDNGAADDAPAMVRHALLGTDPSVGVAGWSGTAYNIIGAKGVRVQAMKAGDNYMLICKENEMYRLSGFGRGLAGWQYVVQPLDNTAGIGCMNPRAIAFSKGYWYGVGASGPWRSDGESVESMIGPKRRSWASVTSLSKCWVVNHPDRQHILFGFVTAGNTTTQDLWCWDEQREVWSSTWTFDPESRPLTHACAIPTAIYNGPSVAPDIVTFTHASSTFTTITGTVTLGDVTASTEIWCDKGAGFVLDQTLAPAVTGFTITGLTKNNAWTTKARHIKGAITSGFSQSNPGFTLLEVPTLSASPAGTTQINLVIGLAYNLHDLVIKRGVTTIKTISPAIAGTYYVTDSGLTCNTGYGYTAYTTSVAWPAPITQSGNAAASATTIHCSGGV